MAQPWTRGQALSKQEAPVYLHPVPPPPNEKEEGCILLSVDAKTRFYLCRASRLLCQPHAVGKIANTFFIHQPHKFSFLH